MLHPKLLHSSHSENRLDGSRSWVTRIALGVSALALAGTLVGCSNDETAQSENNTSNETSLVTATNIDIANMDFDYSNRDKDASYDEATATKIELANTTASVDGDGAAVSDGTITITEPGTYIVSGSLDNGQLIVDMAGEDDKAQVVLNNATIHNETGPAFYVLSADKVFLTLADGSTNTLTDGNNFVLDENDDEPNATLYSKDDLTINGSGTLQVSSTYEHAINSKDDLVITGGTYEIASAADGLRGKDCVKILDGTFTVTATDDAIKSNNDSDASRGFISIDGGTFTLKAGDDGIQSATLFRITEGDVTINSDDDGVNSDIQANIEGGKMTINAGDDGIHAEFILNMDNGLVDVQSSVEGLEAEKIYFNDGTVNVVSSDDGVNASAADTSTGQTTTASLKGSNQTMGTDNDSEFEQVDFQMAAGSNSGMRGPQGGMGMANENCLIQFNGGIITVNAQGDGLDSNGSIEFNGGEIYVSGASNGDNSAIDIESSATINGGKLIAVGGTGMGDGLTGGNQPFARAMISGKAGDTITVTDASGKTLLSWTSPKAFQMLEVSSPEFSEGTAYTIHVGSSSVDATASTTASATGGFGPQGGMQPGQRGEQTQNGMEPPTDQSDQGSSRGQNKGRPSTSSSQSQTPAQS